MSENKQITLEDVYDALIGINQNLTKKIENVEGEIKNIRGKIDVEIKDVKNKVTELQTENKQLKNRIKDLERKTKRKNIIIYGLKEVANEPENLINTVENLVTNKLQITNFRKYDISNVFRLGKKVDKRNRPILVELISQITKNDILRNKIKLKGSDVYISEDLIPEDREEQKIIYTAYKKVKLSNKVTSIKGKNLIIEGTTFTPKDITENKHLQYCPTIDYHSPPSPRKVYSEPSTPTCDNTKTIEEGEESEECSNRHEKTEDKKRKLDGTPEKSISQRKKSNLYQLRSNSGTRQ